MSRSIAMRRIKLKEGIRIRKYSQRTLYPILHIEGTWLHDAGFTAGSHVYLFIEEGKIILKLEPETEIEANAIKMFNAIN